MLLVLCTIYYRVQVVVQGVPIKCPPIQIILKRYYIYGNWIELYINRVRNLFVKVIKRDNGSKQNDFTNEWFSAYVTWINWFSF